jgi:hypothetical protein
VWGGKPLTAVWSLVVLAITVAGCGRDDSSDEAAATNAIAPTNVTATNTIAPTSAAATNTAAPPTPTSTPRPTATREPTPVPAGPVEIALQVLYPQAPDDHFERVGTSERSLGASTMAEFLPRLIEGVNEVYLGSGINGQFVLVDHRQIDLNAKDPNWESKLPFLFMNGVNPTSNDQERAIWSAVSALRDEVAADIIVFWRRPGTEPSANGAAAIGAEAEEAFVQMTYFGMPVISTLAHELGHILGAYHEDGYIGTARFDVDGEPRDDRYRTVMTITSEMTSEGAPLPYIRRFSSPTGRVDGEVGCDVYLSLMSGGIRQVPLTCLFDDAPLGDAEHNAVGAINANVVRVSQFR